MFNVCIVGHVDAGKSTLAGRLAHFLKTTDRRTLRKEEETNADSEAASAIDSDTDSGKSNALPKCITDEFNLSFLECVGHGDAVRDQPMRISQTDGGVEKKRGIVRGLRVNMKKFETRLLDCPGQRDSIGNVVTGVAGSDVGVVVVPASGFESAIGEDGMVKSHITIAGILGCNKLVICVNKMDEIEEEKGCDRFNEISSRMRKIVEERHPDKDPIILPICALKGTGLTSCGEKYPWFRGWQGDVDTPVISTLEDALNSQAPHPSFVDRPLRVPVVSVLQIPGLGLVCTGRVASGTIVPGMKVAIQPSGVYAEVGSLEIHKEVRNAVSCGEVCGMTLKCLSKGDLGKVKTGDVISRDDETAVRTRRGALASMIVVDKPHGVRPGYTPVMDLGTHHVPVTIAKVVTKMTTSDEIVKQPESVTNFESFSAVIIPRKPIVMEVMKDCPSLGRFVVRENGNVTCVGSICQLIASADLVKNYGIEDCV
eukprot:Blabericola_migrator_1__9640@NODE_526_length_7839_cov_99_241251_g402_i0_p1_GENE_NODE_526_length_7839_cov_99_241251_g402_i0NODE_526_length_7839_cov_99_241251_g402_i0_p1_ORF_typecomplete_len483_score48_18GTP_EFTU/PF00009_27/6_5e25GTP_EFTU/PF00009_27/1_7e03GTP_EFTU_D3/PF03143_17/1e04GTP_EFTU_D3/PF03143_17/4_9e19GTP_EFTU_D2/PF03144_25/8_9e03GTP_EFTU_D2/PF03144_25/1_4e07MMR_HSR1/PF01926_23/0_00061PduVEutP/PF10662_9/0_03PduVEutP/PF10662_9/4_2e03RsgA_GTPase/PF03193_16/1_8RsgA_GTPase/PF03193_16/49ATP_bi